MYSLSGNRSGIFNACRGRVKIVLALPETESRHRGENMQRIEIKIIRNWNSGMRWSCTIEIL